MSALHLNWMVGHQHRQGEFMPFRRIVVSLLLSASFTSLCAAKEDPVQWTLAPFAGKSDVAPRSTAYFELKAVIDPDGISTLRPLRPADPSSLRFG